MESLFTEGGFHIDRFITIQDKEKSVKPIEVYRCNIVTKEDAEKWLKGFSKATNTNWIARTSIPSPQRSEFRKMWLCQHASHNKSSKKKTERNLDCKAHLQIKIKKLNRNTKRNDCYLRRKIPLQGLVVVNANHNHSMESFDILRMLRASDETHTIFLDYFNQGLSAAEARRLHESKLSEMDGADVILANASKNPCERTIRHWHADWREAKYGKRNTGHKIDENDPPYDASYAVAAEGESRAEETLASVDEQRPCSLENETFTQSPSSPSADFDGLMRTLREESMSFLSLIRDSELVQKVVPGIIQSLQRIQSSSQAEDILLRIDTAMSSSSQCGRCEESQTSRVSRERTDVQGSSKRLATGPPSNIEQPAKQAKKV